MNSILALPIHRPISLLLERMNRAIMKALAAYVEGNPSTWDDKLPFMTFFYNRANKLGLKLFTQVS